MRRPGNSSPFRSPRSPYWRLWAGKRSRAPLAVLLLFGGTLFPALGFVNVYPFEAAVRAAPRYVMAQNNLAGALLLQGRIQEAKERYQIALRIMPDYEAARRNLALIESMERAKTPPR
jgi:tetratricopeptide (TPR) repeat protein